MRRKSKAERFPMWKVAVVVDHTYVDGRARLRLELATGGYTAPHDGDTVKVSREVIASDAYEALQSVRHDIESADFDVVSCWVC